MYCICYITQSILRSSSYLLIPMLTLLSSGNHAQTNSSYPRLTFLTLASYSRCVFSFLLSVWPSILVYASFIKFLPPPPRDFCEFSESLFLGGREKPLLSACIWDRLPAHFHILERGTVHTITQAQATRVRVCISHYRNSPTNSEKQWVCETGVM